MAVKDDRNTLDALIQAFLDIATSDFKLATPPFKFRFHLPECNIEWESDLWSGQWLPPKKGDIIRVDALYCDYQYARVVDIKDINVTTNGWEIQIIFDIELEGVHIINKEV